MKGVNISKIKASLSEYLAKVKEGEEIILTERGYPIAKIIPFKGAVFYSKQRNALARKGILQLGKGKISPSFLEPSPVVDEKGTVLEALLNEREEAH